MLKNVLCIITFIVLLVPVAAAGQRTQDTGEFPSKEVVLVIPAAAGGGTDLVGRAIAKLLEEELGVPIAIQNSPGAGGVVALNEVIAARPDGYTMGVWANRGVMTAVLLGEGARFDENSFEYLAGVNITAELIILKPGSTINSTEEFIAAAKARPGAITLAIPGVGPVTAYVQLQQEMGINIQPVVYGGGAQVLPAILGGHVEAGIMSAAFAETVLEQGARILGVTAQERLESIPDIPTFVEQGFPGLVNETTRIFMVPKETPEEAVRVLSDAFDKIAADGRLQKVLTDMNEVPLYRGNKDVSKFLESNFLIFRKIIEENREDFLGN